MGEDRVKELRAKIAELKKRWPAHSPPPAMMQELDELESELAHLRKQERKQKPEA
jgi:hypothetical protein